MIRVPLNQCAECGEQTSDRKMICHKCAPMYDRLVTDECNCLSCRSDMAGIIPCALDEGAE